MKKYRIPLSGVLVCLAMIFTLSACGDGQDKEGRTPTPTQAGSVTVAPPAFSSSERGDPSSSDPSRPEDEGDMTVQFKDPGDSDNLVIVPKQ